MKNGNIDCVCHKNLSFTRRRLNSKMSARELCKARLTHQRSHLRGIDRMCPVTLCVVVFRKRSQASMFLMFFACTDRQTHWKPVIHTCEQRVLRTSAGLLRLMWAPLPVLGAHVPQTTTRRKRRAPPSGPQEAVAWNSGIWFPAFKKCFSNKQCYVNPQPSTVGFHNVIEQGTAAFSSPFGMLDNFGGLVSESEWRLSAHTTL